MIRLSHLQPFSSGLFRDCFIHPDDPAKCIKLARPLTTANADASRSSVRRTENPNELEYKEYQSRSADGVPLERYLPRFYGFVDTDRGQGLCVELLRNDDGSLPVSIEHYLSGRSQLDGLDQATLKSDYAAFADFCVKHAILASSDELSNVSYIHQNGVYRFIVFDMKRRQNLELIPVSSFIPFLRRRKIYRRFQRSQAQLEKRLAEMPSGAILSQ